MSWSGFKKNVGRATTQVMMKTGHVEKTSDREYEVEERRYRVLETASLRLQKEAKGYLDSLRAMTASQMRIAETIDAFYGDSGARDGVGRSYKQAVEDLDAETIKALDGPYRQTVLEPINRFCAYFPDINECIKKRNHKLLDYDALRSKVKKLTEKPDKDASKLPRTEKELEMVTPESQRYTHESSTSSVVRDVSPGLIIPSPPKILAKLRARTPYISVVNDPVSEPASPAGRSASMPVMNNKPLPPIRATSTRDLDSIEELPTSEALAVLRNPPDHGSARLKPYGSLERSQLSITPPLYNAFANHPALTPRTPDHQMDPFRSSLDSNLSFPSIPSSRADESAAERSSSTYKRSDSRQSVETSHSTTSRPSLTRTPFFNPSELEDLMRPLKDEFLQARADKVEQAKASYDQLNDQLTSELPQLIDLRVPYLDPSFEALVKIQLRFCAEAYSRMAQVQQYLDASTRDQYASGDLDARVEDVLGQIRELSIAGTV